MAIYYNSICSAKSFKCDDKTSGCDKNGEWSVSMVIMYLQGVRVYIAL